MLMRLSIGLRKSLVSTQPDDPVEIWGRETMDDEIRVGDMVEIAVYVGTERRPAGKGRVVAVHSGYCDVDHCYPCAAPWVYAETTRDLRKITWEKDGNP
jgi:hypothetical protein